MTSAIKGSEKNTNHKTHTFYGTHTVTVCSLLFYSLIGITSLMIPTFMDRACSLMG